MVFKWCDDVSAWFSCREDEWNGMLLGAAEQMVYRCIKTRRTRVTWISMNMVACVQVGLTHRPWTLDDSGCCSACYHFIVSPSPTLTS